METTAKREQFLELISAGSVVSSWVKEEPTVMGDSSTLCFSVAMSDVELCGKLLTTAKAILGGLDYVKVIDSRYLKGKHVILIILEVAGLDWEKVKEDFEAKYMDMMNTIGLYTDVVTLSVPGEEDKKAVMDDMDISDMPFVIKSGWACERPLGGLLAYGLGGSMLTAPAIMAIAAVVNDKYGDSVDIQHEVEAEGLTVMMFFEVADTGWEEFKDEFTEFVHGHLSELCHNIC